MTKYALLAVLSGCLFGLNGLIGRILTGGGLDSVEIGSCRFILAAVIYFFAAVREDPHSLKIRLHDIWIFLCCGVVGQVMYSLLFFSAVEIMPLSIATTACMLWPFFVVFLSWLVFGERPTWRKLLAAGMAFAGCAVNAGVFGTAAPPLRGVLLSLGAGLAYSFFSVFSTLALRRGYTPKAISFYSWLFAAVGSRMIWPGQRPLVHMFSSVSTAAAGLFLGIVIGYIGNLLYLKALTGIDAGKASVLTFSSPVVAAIVGVAVYHEPFTLWQLLGLALIVCAMPILRQKSRGNPQKN